MPKLDDTEMSGLIRAGLVGSSKAYEEFFKKLVPVLSRMVAAIAPSFTVSETEDVVQEIMLAIHSKRHTWKQNKPVLPWVYAIARYKLIDRLRYLKRQHSWIVDVDLDTLEGASEFIEHDRRHDLEKGVKTLTGKTGHVWNLIGLQGKTIKEASQEVGMSENAVRLHMHRGLQKIRNLFRVEEDHECETSGKD